MRNEKRPQEALSTAGTATASVAPLGDTSYRLPTAPAAWATAYSPAGLRRRWAAVIRCPFCQGGHVVYGRDLDSLRGIKKANCGLGRKVWVVISYTVTATVEAVPDVAA